MTYSDVNLGDIDHRGLERAVAVAAEAKDTGNLAFGAVLFDAAGNEVGSAHNTVLTTGDPTDHAETLLVRLAAAKFNRAELGAMTMYASCEPCAMCAGAIFVSGIRRVLYALPAARLRAMVDDRAGTRLPSLLLTAKAVLDSGEETTVVTGGFPIPGSEALFTD